MFADAHNRDILNRTSSSFSDGFGDSGGAALRNNDSARSGRVSRSYDGTQVLRILNTIEYDKQLCAFGDVAQVAVLHCGSVGQNP